MKKLFLMLFVSAGLMACGDSNNTENTNESLDSSYNTTPSGDNYNRADTSNMNRDTMNNSGDTTSYNRGM